MKRILLVGAGNALLNSVLVAKLSTELAALDCKIVEADAVPEMALTLTRRDFWPELEQPLCTQLYEGDASRKLITASNPGSGAASGYNEFVASRGGKYGASRRRP